MRVPFGPISADGETTGIPAARPAVRIRSVREGILNTGLNEKI